MLRQPCGVACMLKVSRYCVVSSMSVDSRLFISVDRGRRTGDVPYSSAAPAAPSCMHASLLLLLLLLLAAAATAASPPIS